MADYQDEFQNTYLKNISVMIVDDQPFVTQMLSQIIRVLGATDIRLFTDAGAAWMMYKKEPTDIVILDWEMQPMNGLQLTQMIRRNPDSPNVYVPIIMVTGHRGVGNVFQARDTGVTEYVIKPIVPKSLFSRIEAVIERPRRFVRVGEYFGPDRRRKSKEFVGTDKRGEQQNAAKKSAPADQAREMGQDEINNAFNPDDVPATGTPASDKTD